MAMTPGGMHAEMDENRDDTSIKRTALMVPRPNLVDQGSTSGALVWALLVAGCSHLANRKYAQAHEPGAVPDMRLRDPPRTN